MLKRNLLLGAGWLALALGAVGLVLPVFPTTPFVLLAASSFAAGSPKLYSWLEHSRFFGEFVRNYKDKTGISRANKVRALVFLWGMLLLSCVLVQKLPITLLLAVVGSCVTVHILMLRTRV